MYISINWIKDFVDLEDLNSTDIDNLIHKFSMSTAEVEGIEHKGENLSGVIVGKITSVENIPTSHKLHKLSVFDGVKNVQVVCGAPNVKEGMLVAFAKVGSIVGGEKIDRAVLADTESFGMCMSAKELGISDDHSGLLELTEGMPGQDIKEILELDDVIFEVDNKSLTNRPDLWGHYGIAREIAAISGRALKPLDLEDLSCYNNLPEISIDVKDKDKCYRYTSLAVENITHKVSPMNMAIRLYYTGSRQINLLADLTNYIMLELGQPMHAFNKEKVSSIKVDSIKQEEEFVTLDGVRRILPEGTLCIYNENEKAAIAGVMGGLDSQITDDTNSLLLESANFDATAIRKTAIKLGLRTDASAHYEKTLDPTLTYIAIQRFIYLLKKIDPNIKIVSQVTDVYVKHFESIEIDITREYIVKHIGVDITIEKMEAILTSLGFKVETHEDNMRVYVPSFRATKDISIKADLVEEIARIYGYDNIPPKTKVMDVSIVPVNESLKTDSIIKDILSKEYGASELHSYVWYDTKKCHELGIKLEDNIKIINSLDMQNNVLRETMIPTMLCMVEKNVKNFDDIAIFEIGKTWQYPEKGKNAIESKKLGLTFSSKVLSEKDLIYKAVAAVSKIVNDVKHKKVVFEEMCTKDIILEKYNWINARNACNILVDGVNLGYISTLNLKVAENIDKKVNCVLVEMYIDKLNNIEKENIKVKEISKYQTVTFDLNFLVNEFVKYSSFEKVLEAINLEYLSSYELLDIYEDKEKLGDKKSVTLRFTLVSQEHTLTADEINSSRDGLILAFEKEGIKLR